MISEIPQYIKFENFTIELLKFHGFDITQTEQKNNSQYDFKAKRNSDLWAVEVKFYKTSRAQMPLIESAATQLAIHISNPENLKGMLIISCAISKNQREYIEKKYGILLVDRSDLFNWASNRSDLTEELVSILEEIYLPELSSGRVLNEISTATLPNTQSSPPAADSKGSAICQKIRDLKPGKDTWREYETLCDEILRYLFTNDLCGWHSQEKTSDDLNRFDYICRIMPTTKFWEFLINQLNSAYIIFEFKNYSKEIKQGQILTTEKYLLEKGLRKVAIIFSRLGADKNSIAMTQGAMRENGKLIIVLDDEKVCKMLTMRENGEDPTDLLFDIADKFLISLPR